MDEIQLESEDLQKGHPTLTRQLKVTEQYARVIRQIAAEYPTQVRLVDLWSSLMDEALKLGSSSGKAGVPPKDYFSSGLRTLLVDGLHLSAAGYKVFFETVLPFIGEEWKREPSNNPSWIFPHWSIAPSIE